MVPSVKQISTSTMISLGYILIYFGENQLSPGSIGISPLPTPHPVTFQRKSVRPSIQCYLDFSLDMGRSPGFGSTTIYCGALFRLAFAAAPHSLLNLAYHRKSPVHSTKGTPSPINEL